MTISSHILDTTLGKPAAGVELQLFTAAGELLRTAITNADGRVTSADFDLTAEQFVAGDYYIEFAVKAYFEAQKTETFFPKCVIHFTVADAAAHYHVPLLISPYSFSTYRGS